MVVIRTILLKSMLRAMSYRNFNICDHLLLLTSSRLCVEQLLEPSAFKLTDLSKTGALFECCCRVYEFDVGK